MKKMYHLATCNTCKKIIAQLGAEANGVELQNIKEDKITPEQLDHMKSLAGSYEALFSKRSMKYRSMGLKDKTLSEDDLRSLILEEYTFLKRPVSIVGDQIFIGNAKSQVEGTAEALANA